MGQQQATQWQGYEQQLFKDEGIQTFLVPNTAEKNSTPIIRNPRAKNGFVGFLMDDEKRELDTAYKLFTAGVSCGSNKPFVGYRKYLDKTNIALRGNFEYMTYKEFENYVLSYGNGLRSLLNNENDQNIGIFSLNRPEWYVAHMGNLSQNYKTVALYDVLGADTISYIIGHAELPVVVCEKNKLKELFKAIVECKKKEKLQNNKNEAVLKFKLKYVIQMDYDKRYNNEHEAIDENDKKTAAEHNIQLIGLSELLSKGKDKNNVVHCSKEDIAYIMYTSGTTGDPKGVILTHQAFASIVASAQREFNITSHDVYVSYLPLAHIFEAAAQALISAQGASVAYFQGDIRKISDDFVAVQPTILVGVPRVFSKTYERYKFQVKQYSKVMQTLVESAEHASTLAIREGKRNNFYDTMVWKKAAHAVGFGRVRLAVSGAAPLPSYVAEFLRIFLPNCIVRQGYGMTETTAGITLTRGDDFNFGHVGIPVDNMEIRLIDAPECNYFVKDEPCPRGEILARGLATMLGYHKNDEQTKSTLTKDGWVCTGDIGRLNPNGTISVIDRRKNMFKTSHGEYIAAEKLEIEYAKANGVSQIWIYGNSFKSFVVAIVVPDASFIPSLLKEKNLWGDDKHAKTLSDSFLQHYHEVVSKNVKVVKEHFMAEFKTIEKQSQLKPFECIKDFHIECKIDNMGQAFTIENSLLTPTFKVKRPQLLLKYIDILKELYSKNGEPPLQGEEWIKK